MKFLNENCIRQIKVPEGKINCFDYSSGLNLIAAFEDNTQTAYVWNPDSGEVVKEIDLIECHADILFLPEGRHIAVPWDEAHHGSGVTIYSIDSGEEVLELGDVDMGLSGGCVALALTPDNNLLVGAVFYEFKIDFKNMKAVKKRLIYEGGYSYPYMCMCCSKSSYTFLFALDDSESREGFTRVNVDFSASSKVITSEEVVTHCFIDGEEREFGYVQGLAFDGDNVIVATCSEIIALESATEGSIGHVIVSSGISLFDGQLRIYDKGQLMVCNGSDTISVYQYKETNTLQGLCRHTINNILKQRKAQVADLPLPNSMKSYLVYKV